MSVASVGSGGISEAGSKGLTGGQADGADRRTTDEADEAEGLATSTAHHGGTEVTEDATEGNARDVG